MKIPGLSQNPVPPAAFTAEEAADYLRISRAGVYRLMKDRKLPRAKIGDRTVIRRVDLDAFLASAVEVA
ncbi:MAG: helix-turn-helix domain-containing protein [Inquilinus sp.]|uniref:helix-turn-helix domain-containing protein n=1 Tax=Inquilinus sp. TaxID=1932117 RepID=UPI003F320B9B